MANVRKKDKVSVKEDGKVYPNGVVVAFDATSVTVDFPDGDDVVCGHDEIINHSATPRITALEVRLSKLIVALQKSRPLKGI